MSEQLHTDEIIEVELDSTDLLALGETTDATGSDGFKDGEIQVLAFAAKKSHLAQRPQR